MTELPPLVVPLVRLDPGLPVPCYAHAGDAGVDLCSTEEVLLAPGERALLATGVALALPHGYVGLVHPRSGLAARHGITVVNAPGTIDAGYRGEIRVALVNTDRAESFQVRRGDRIAQLVVQQFVTVSFQEVGSVENLSVSTRGAGGYGSTGGFRGPGGGGER